jgi:hypothetical protein
VCPVTFGRPWISWEFPDPKNLLLEEVREIRDEIRDQVEALVSELDQKGEERSRCCRCRSRYR